MLQRLIRNLIALSGSHLIGSLANLLLVPLFLARWSVETYGQWLALFSLVAYLSSVDAGLSMAAINRLTQAWTRHDLEDYARALDSAMAFHLAAAAGGAALLAAGVWWLPLASWMRITSPGAALTLFLLGIQMLWTVPLGLLTGIYRTTGDLARSQWIANAQKTGALAVSAAVVLAGGGMAALAAWQLLPLLAATLYAASDVRARFPGVRPGLRGADIRVLRQLIRPSLMFALITLSVAIGQQGPVVIVSSLLGGAAVAVFATSRTLANYMRQITGALNAALWPDVTRLDAIGDRERLRALHRLLVFGSSALCIGMAAALWYAGNDLVRFWTRGRLQPDTALLRWLVAMAALQCPWLASSVVTAAMNRHGRLARSYFVASVLGVLAAAILAPRCGLAGVAAGLLAGELCACWHFVIQDTCRRIEEPYPAFARRLWGGLPVVAGAAMAAGWAGRRLSWATLGFMTVTGSVAAAWLVWRGAGDRLAASAGRTSRAEARSRASAPRRHPFRVAYVVSHPIQYQAPMLRHIAAQPEIDLTVFYQSDASLGDHQDEGFGVRLRWDVPLLGGYRHVFAGPRRIGEHLAARRFDAVWLHGYASAAQLRALAAAKRLGIPVLVRGESHDASASRHWPRRALATGLFRVPDAFLSIGSRNRDYYLGGGVPPERIFSMPYAVDNRFFQTEAGIARRGRAAFRAELALEAGRPVILFASKMQSRKRAGDLLEAYMRLSDGRREPAPYLLFVGDGEERPRLEALARGAGWGSIRFLGFRNQTELPRFYDLCDVFVLPSEREPWGLAVNEAMNAARAVIVTGEAGCAPDLVEDGVNGFIVPARDVACLAERLKRLTGCPPLAAEMGRRSLRRISRWSFEEDAVGLLEALRAGSPA